MNADLSVTNSRSFPDSNSDFSTQGASSLVPASLWAGWTDVPDAIAVASEAGSLSYLDLRRRSSALAKRLKLEGVGANVPVGIRFERSPEFIVAAVGSWLAGGAYLPIDPAYPVERAGYMLADSGAPVLVTSRDLANTIEGGSWKTIFIEDIDVSADSGVEAPNPAVDDLAYVIYTSGSTGLPKGVEITHGNLANLVEWHNAEFEITPDDRATQVAGPGFDAAVWEIWPYLAAGASIHIPSEETRLAPLQLRDWLIANQVTISFVPTILAEQLIRLEWPAANSLRYLLTGADKLSSFPPAGLPFRFVNNYGPTECAVVATSAVVPPSVGGGLPSIGRAISNTAVYLLDADGNEVEAGDPGEIYIGGTSVGRGYRNRPDLTAKAFVNITVRGKRVRTYRTGDLAKLLPDGQYAFLGRADDQIKIRGFRIEPGEISAVLNRDASIAASAVIAREDGGEKQLVGYVVLAPNVRFDESRLRDLAAAHLPDYMVPARFVLMSELPLTANGKLDKAALPAPKEKKQVLGAYVAPSSEIEELVEQMLRPMLGMDRVSVHDNFFLLGGHSLMGAQLIAKLRDTFGVELSLRDIFNSATIAKLSAKIESILVVQLSAMSDEEVEEALGASQSAV